MKKHNIIFWTTTGIFSIMMLFSAFNYVTNAEVTKAFHHLGFPDYFRIELAVAKALGALALILPFVPRPVKLFAYVGFSINLLSAAIAHYASGDPFSATLAPVLFLGILVASYISYNRRHMHPKLV